MALPPASASQQPSAGTVPHQQPGLDPSGLMTAGSEVPMSEGAASTMPAHQRALAIQASLREIVLQTGYALRSRTQIIKMGLAGNANASMPSGADEAATSLEPLGAECARYLALVRGLRDYLLHAQASLEIELEKATKREAAEAELAQKAADAAAKAAAEAAEEAASLQRQKEEGQQQQQQQQQESSASSGVAPTPAKAADQPVTLEASAASASDAIDVEMDQSISTPPLPPTSSAGDVNAPPLPALAEPQPTSTKDPSHHEASGNGGANSSSAIVIDSDDEDDVPLAFAPKSVEGSEAPQLPPNTGGSAAASRAGTAAAIDLTGDDTPKRSNPALPPVNVASTTGPASSAKSTEGDDDPGSDLFGDGDQQSTTGDAESKNGDAAQASVVESQAEAAQAPSTQPDASATSAAPATSTATATATGLGGMDLSSFGIDINNLPDLSSLQPSLDGASGGGTAGLGGLDLSSLGGMMGIDLSSFNVGTSSETGGGGLGGGSSSGDHPPGLPGFSLGGSGDGGLGSLDLSNFDFSSLGGDANGSGAGTGAGSGGGGGIDLSAFLQGYATGEAGSTGARDLDGTEGGAGSG